LKLRALVSIAGLCLVGCKESSNAPGSSNVKLPPAAAARAEMKSPVGGLGEKRVSGPATDLRATNDGKTATFLLDAEKPRLDGIPPGLRVGELHAIPTAGGESFKIGNGVTNAPGGYTFSPDGRWVLVLIGFNFADSQGELFAKDLWDPKKARVRLGGEVTFMRASPDSKQVAFIEAGSLKVGPLPEGPFKDVATSVQSAAFSPDGKVLYFKRRLTQNGGLYVVPLGDSLPAPKKLADQVGDWETSADGKWLAYAVRTDTGRASYDLTVADTTSWKGKSIAENTCWFEFSPDSKTLAHTVGCKPGERAGDLFVGPSDGSSARKLGDQVHDVKFTTTSSAIAWLEMFDVTPREKGRLPTGIPAVAVLPDGAPRKLGRRAPHYEWSADGKFLAFLEVAVRDSLPVYELTLHKVGAPAEEKPVVVAQGVFGYQFTPDSSRLLVRSMCIRDGRACDLFAHDPNKPADPPKKLTEQIFSFKVSEDSTRVLTTYARMQGDTYDVAVTNLKTGETKTLEQIIQMPALFLKPDGSQLVYAVADKARPGVYVCNQVP
jgi:hypothetical protein